MLTEAMTDALLEIFEERWHAIITEYLSSMGDHLADIGELLPSDANRIIEMRRMGVTMERIRKQIAHAAQQSEEDVIRAMQAIAKADAAFAERIFGSKLTASGRSALKRVLEAQARVTFGEMENLSRTTVLSDGYRKAVDKAVQAVQGGVSDYRSAIRRTVEEAAAEGLRVEYPTKTPSGRNRSMRLDSAVRMNVLDGVRAMNRAAMEQIGEEYGADGIEISAHALCATDHLPYQGLQYSKEEFEELQQSLGRPIGAWNCKHMTWPIILGVSECTYSKEELAEMNRFSTEEIEIDGRTKTRYEWSQEQRRIETAVRYQKDRANLARHSGHDDIRRDAQAKINKLTKAYEGISEKTRLGAEWDRMRVAGFRSVKEKAAMARGDAVGHWPAGGTPISKAEFRELKAYAEERGVQLRGFEHFDGDVSLVRNFVDGMHHVAQDFPKVNTAFKGGLQLVNNRHMAPEDYADAGKHSSININAAAFRNREILGKDYAERVQEGWFAAGTTYESIAYHEMGHVIHNAYRFSAREAIGNADLRAISLYASASVSEGLAETVSAIYAGSTNKTVLTIWEKCIKMIKKGEGAK